MAGAVALLRRRRMDSPQRKAVTFARHSPTLPRTPPARGDPCTDPKDGQFPLTVDEALAEKGTTRHVPIRLSVPVAPASVPKSAGRPSAPRAAKKRTNDTAGATGKTGKSATSGKKRKSSATNENARAELARLVRNLDVGAFDEEAKEAKKAKQR